jgi:phage head maturation protease
MPWEIFEHEGQFCLRNTQTKKMVAGSCHADKEMTRKMQMAMYAAEPSAAGKSEDNMTDLIYDGGEVKALGEGRIGGYLVRFTTAADPDLTNDFFTPDTDFFLGDDPKAWVLYDHGRDGTLKARKLGQGQLRIDNIGLWIEAQLKMRDHYEKAIYELAKKGKLGWSSGALNHLVEREPEGNAQKILTWPIGEASLTPNPAEFRNEAFSLKSFVDAQIQLEQVERAASLGAIADSIAPEVKTETKVEPMPEPAAVIEKNDDNDKRIGLINSLPALKKLLAPVDIEGGLQMRSDTVEAAGEEVYRAVQLYAEAVKHHVARVHENTQFRFEKDGRTQSKPKRRSVEVSRDQAIKLIAKLEEVVKNHDQLLSMFDMTDAQQAATNEKARHELFRSYRLATTVRGE